MQEIRHLGGCVPRGDDQITFFWSDDSGAEGHALHLRDDRRAWLHAARLALRAARNRLAGRSLVSRTMGRPVGSLLRVTLYRPTHRSPRDRHGPSADTAHARRAARSHDSTLPAVLLGVRR